jgi:hypothetical protein
MTGVQSHQLYHDATRRRTANDIGRGPSHSGETARAKKSDATSSERTSDHTTQLTAIHRIARTPALEGADTMLMDWAGTLICLTPLDRIAGKGRPFAE